MPLSADQLEVVRNFVINVGQAHQHLRTGCSCKSGADPCLSCQHRQAVEVLDDYALEQVDEGHLVRIIGFRNNVAIQEYVFVCRPDYSVYSNVPTHCVEHSPAGFNYGYHGSGPADFALNILEDYLWCTNHNPGNERMNLHQGSCFRKAWDLHQEFKRDFLAPLDGPGPHKIDWADIKNWMREMENEA